MRRLEKCKVCFMEFEVYMSRKPVTYCSVACKRSDYRAWHPIINKKYIHPKKQKVMKVDRRFKWKSATPEEIKQRLTNIFNSRVIKSDGCWKWNGKLHNHGYAVMVINSTHNQIGAHRVSWMIHHGDIPDNLWVLHKCDNKGCTNPEHLFLGTVKDNYNDMVSKKREYRALGENHPFAKLTVEKVKEIKRLLEMGVTMKRICKDYGMSNGAVNAIKKKITWKHV